MEKAFTWRFGLTSLELRNFFKICQKQSNGECLMGMFSYSFVILVVTTRITHKVSYIHIGVRLRVARFDKSGNAKALRTWSEQRVTGFTLFLYYKRNYSLPFEAGGTYKHIE